MTEVVLRVDKIWVERQRFMKLFQGFIGIADRAEEAAEIVIGRNIIWALQNQCATSGNCLTVITHGGERFRQVIYRIGIAGPDLQRSLVMLDCVFVLSF